MLTRSQCHCSCHTDENIKHVVPCCVDDDLEIEGMRGHAKDIHTILCRFLAHQYSWQDAYAKIREARDIAKQMLKD